MAYVTLHASAVLTTIFLVLSGFDWKYCVFVLSTMPDKLLLAADISGYVFAVFVPFGLLLAGWLLRNSFYRLYVEAVLFAVVLGFTLSTLLRCLLVVPHHPLSSWWRVNFN